MTTRKQTPGEIIRASRNRLGLTQQQLAETVNDRLPEAEVLERTMISRWEKDQHFPRPNRKAILEQVLGVNLGNQPLRRETFANYVTSLAEIRDSLQGGLKDCSELWITNTVSSAGILSEVARVKKIVDRLRRSDSCIFKELYYVNSLEDLSKVKASANSNHKKYSVRVRYAPGYPFPLLVAPGNEFATMLSGFTDDIHYVSLELQGNVAGFIEHHFRYHWGNATPIRDEDGTIHTQNLRQVSDILKRIRPDKMGLQLLAQKFETKD